MKLSPDYKPADPIASSASRKKSSCLDKKKKKMEAQEDSKPMVSAASGFDFGMSQKTGLVPLTAVRLLLGKSTAAVKALIEEGRLRWVFDIRCASAHRCEIRVLRKSLLECAGLCEQPPRDSRPPTEEEDFRDTVTAVLPKGFRLTPQTASAGTQRLNNYASGRPDEILLPDNAISAVRTSGTRSALFPQEPVLRGTDVARFLDCSGEHVAKLITQGLLNAANFRRGPTTTPLVFRSSVLTFLKSRRML